MAATNKQRAQRVTRDVKAAFPGADFTELQPLYEYRNDGRPLVSWEEGPYDWAIQVSWKLNEEYSRQGVDIFVEPQTSYQLAVFPR